MSRVFFTQIVTRTGAFIAQMFAFGGMYERKAVYVRQRYPR